MKIFQPILFFTCRTSSSWRTYSRSAVMISLMTFVLACSLLTLNWWGLPTFGELSLLASDPSVFCTSCKWCSWFALNWKQKRQCEHHDAKSFKYLSSEIIFNEIFIQLYSILQIIGSQLIYHNHILI